MPSFCACESWNRFSKLDNRSDGATPPQMRTNCGSYGTTPGGGEMGRTLIVSSVDTVLSIYYWCISDGLPIRLMGRDAALPLVRVLLKGEEKLSLSESIDAFVSLANSIPQLVRICTPDGANIYFNLQFAQRARSKYSAPTPLKQRSRKTQRSSSHSPGSASSSCSESACRSEYRCQL